MTKIRPDGPRDPVAGPETGPEKPFPIKLNGPVVEGFGRGSRELGIPTANIPPTGLSTYPDLESGVYFGFVGLRLSEETTQPADNSKLTLSASAQSTNTTTTSIPPSQPHSQVEGNTIGVYEAVLSIGYNPFYNNTTRSIEIHILHPFPSYNFYHSPLNLLVLGFIRPEYNYDSLELLVQDIKMDCEVAKRSLERTEYTKYKEEEGAWLRGFEWVGTVDVGELERVERGEGAGGEGAGSLKEEGKL